MKEKKWIFFNVMVYLGLAFAIAIFGMLTYSGFFKYRHLQSYYILYVSIACVLQQIIFQLLNIRLVHHYLPKKLQPNKIFNITHSILLMINSLVAVAALVLFISSFSEAIFNNFRKPNQGDMIALWIIGCYTFIITYTVAAVIVVRRYIKYQSMVEEEKWLVQIGNQTTI